MPAASFKSVVEMFHHRVRSTPDAEAYFYRKGSEWQSMFWKDVGHRARAIACGLRSLGIKDEDRVCIQSGTRVEWILADMGILCSGAACTTIYPSSTPEEVAYIVNDSGARMVFAENDKQVAKLQSKRAEMPNLVNVIVFDGAASADGWVLSLDDLEKRGAGWDAANAGEYDRFTDAVGPDHLATLIYTSGTTGNPKGVILNHSCWVFEGEAIDALNIMTPADKQYLFLPLAHSFGKVLECAQLRIGFSTAVDGDIDSLVANLAVQKPTFMGAVPRIFEKVYNKIVSGAREKGGVSLKIFTWAVGVGKEVSQARQKGEEPGGFLMFKYSVADKLVFSKIRAVFGGRIRLFISGAAPLSREIAEFFHGAGVFIAEGYGLTESSAASFVNRPDAYRFGTVGQPVPGVEVRIEKDGQEVAAGEDGEILIKSPGVMKGYYNKAEQTAEALDSRGYLHTGDVGHIAEGGFLRITDRIKDLIKTSGGKYVAPQELEGRLKLKSTLISQVIVHGNNRNFCVALVTLNPDSTPAWARKNGLASDKYDDLVKDDKIRAEIQTAVDALNKDLPSYSTVKRFAILEQDLSQEAGDMTPSLKVKRKAVEAKHKALLDSFYEGALASV
ncbi:MAG: long-chain fatty acid--CoA ligase [Deltaproteobacteria bacterium]|nr:long-chain fatty acid--CoA ligase [Deltaproteobacteria bacterium]